MSPTAILRVENDEGFGPYQPHCVPNIDATSHNYDYVDYRPLPCDDSGLKDIWSATYEMRIPKKIRFGFADDGESLTNWWHIFDQKDLINEGFPVRSLMALRVLHGDKQIVYFVNSEIKENV